MKIVYFVGKILMDVVSVTEWRITTHIQKDDVGVQRNMVAMFIVFIIILVNLMNLLII